MTAVSGRADQIGLTNWAGNIRFAGRLHRPSSLAELQQLVPTLPRVRALGTGHSFNRIADAPDLVSVAGLVTPPELTADATVRVSAGTRYGELAPWLHERGRALANLGSLPHISVGGACATGTHGSGAANRCLAAAARAVTLVVADGSLHRVTRGEASFGGAVLALGGLGVVTELELDTRPAFELRQTVYDDLPWSAVTDSLADVLGGGYSVSIFTRWQRRDVLDMVWVKDDGPPAAEWYGARPADGPRHPIRGVDPVHCTEQGGVPGPWFARLPHFRLEFTPSAGDELQSEYLVDAADGPAAVAAIRELGGRDGVLAPVLQVCEIRTVAADELWLSPAFGRASVALHFTWTADQLLAERAVRAVETVLAPFAPRPHWGKVFTLEPATVRSRYPRLPGFAALARTLDPTGRFVNDFLSPYL